eukprot:242996-Lingulodinium_polyedra.AAC.1
MNAKVPLQKKWGITAAWRIEMNWSLKNATLVDPQGVESKNIKMLFKLAGIEFPDYSKESHHEVIANYGQDTDEVGPASTAGSSSASTAMVPLPPPEATAVPQGPAALVTPVKRRRVTGQGVPPPPPPEGAGACVASPPAGSS